MTWEEAESRLEKVLAESVEVVNILPDRTTQWDITDDIRAALERVEQLERRRAFMEEVDIRKDSGWCGEHPRMFSLRPDADADGECLMCQCDALRQRVEELERQVADEAWIDNLEQEAKALRQRVEELEREVNHDA